MGWRYTEMTFLGIALILLLISVSAGLFMYRSMYVATRGRKIPVYPVPRKALLVLDIQEGYAGTNSRRPVTAPPAGSMLDTINRLIERAVKADMEVAYLRQVFSNNFIVRMHGGRRAGKVIVDRRIMRVNANDFEKNRTDAFSSRQLEQLLIDKQVNEIYLTGVDAAYCVYYTALGALNRGYTVHVVLDAVASRATMDDVVQRYMKKGIGVVTSKELLAEEGFCHDP